MKRNVKWMSLVLSLALMFSVTACDDKGSTKKDDTSTEETVEEAESNEEETEATESEVEETTEQTEETTEESEETEETEETTEPTETEPEKTVEEKVQENVDLIKAYHEEHPDEALYIDYYVDVEGNVVEFKVCSPSADKVTYQFCQDNDFLVNIYPNLSDNACETVGNNLIFVDSFIGVTEQGWSYDIDSCVTYDVFENLTIDEIMNGYELKEVESVPDGSYAAVIYNLKEDGSWCQMKLSSIEGKGVNDGVVGCNPVLYSADFAAPTAFYDDPYITSGFTTAYPSVADSSMLDNMTYYLDMYESFLDNSYLKKNYEHAEIDGCYCISVSAVVKIQNNQITEMIIFPALGDQI